MQIARRWNFTYFTTGGTQEKSELGSVRAVQMEFQTTVSLRSKCSEGDGSEKSVHAPPEVRTHLINRRSPLKFGLRRADPRTTMDLLARAPATRR